MKLPDITEKQFESQVKDLARYYRWMIYHTFLSKWSHAGFPDLVLVRERVIFAEIKRETGQPSAEQYEWLEALAEAGQEVYLWRPSDMEPNGGEILEVLK
jgi:hypothetical protein